MEKVKFFELTDENVEICEDVWQNTGLYNYADLKLLGVRKSKELIKVQKANPQVQYFGKCPGSVICTIYEEAFDRLDKKSKEILIEDALATVSYDVDKDKLNVGAPQIVVTLGGRQKYGDELINAAEAGLLAIQQIEDEKQNE